jgi:hypothetical protein
MMVLYGAFMSDSVEQVFDSYCEYLVATQSEDYYGNFLRRWEENAGPERAEAVVFAWAQAMGFNSRVHETTESGGIDFYCEPVAGAPFLLEVTSLERESTERQSGLGKDFEKMIDSMRPGQPVVAAFKLLTNAFSQRVWSKWKQFNKSDSIPRLLVIASEYSSMSAILLGKDAAIALLVGDAMWPLSGEGSYGDLALPPDLLNSAFFKRDEEGRVTIQNSEFSAIVLCRILSDQLKLVGILHPEPKFPLDLDCLPPIPFLKVREWPLRDGNISLDWTMNPDSVRFYHQRIRLTEEQMMRKDERIRAWSR